MQELAMNDRPNVLVICLDQMRQDFFSLHGHPLVRTPHMDSIGGCGISFQRARSECPTCIPARQTLMTGLDPWGINMFHNVAGQALPCDAPTLAGCLSDAGYQTHAVGKMHWFPERARYGFDEVECDEEYRKLPGNQFHDYERYLRDQGLAHRMTSHGVGPNQYGWRFDSVPEEHSPTHWTADRACNFLERRDPTRPFFLYASFRQPHPPFVVQQAYWEMYRDAKVPLPVIGNWVKEKSPSHWDALHDKHRSHLWMDNEKEIADNIRAYCAMISHIDAMVGVMLGALKEAGVFDNTWILLTADHGEMLFDHRGFAKGTPFAASAGVPWMLRAPVNQAIAQGLGEVLPRIDTNQCVGLADVMPTVLDITGTPIPEGIHGRSVLPFLQNGDSRIRDHQVVVYDQNFGITDGRYQYCWFGDTDVDLLFDLEQDPREEHDLANQQPAVKKRLRAALYNHLAKHDDRHCVNGDLAAQAPKWPIAHARLKDKAMHRGRC